MPNNKDVKELRTRTISLSSNSQPTNKPTHSNIFDSPNLGSSEIGKDPLAIVDTQVNQSQNLPIDTIVAPLVTKLEQKINIKMVFDTSTFLNIVPTFDGSSTELHYFLQCCDTFVDTLGNDQSKIDTFLKLIPTRIKGVAHEKVMKYNKYDTWLELKTALNHNCRETRTVEQLTMELVHAHQDKKETVQEFAHRIEKLLYDLIDASVEREGEDSAVVIKRMHSKTALLAFTNGLCSSIKPIVKASKYDSLKDAIKGAIDEELSNKFFDLNVSSHPTTSFSNNNNNNRSTKCQLCGKRNHIAINCHFRYANTSQSTKSNYNGSSTSRFALFCTYCKINGHHFNECRNKLRQQNKSFNRQSNDSNSNNFVNSRKTSENLKQPDSPGTPIRALDLQSAKTK